MARRSRKGNAKPVVSTEKKIWQAGLYIRLSNLNAGRDDSETIEVQELYLKQSLEDRVDIIVRDTYADNGYTGTNFNRPEFERLLSDIQQKKIDCIVVKDFSRLGRNYIETGYYLEKLFPMLGVRFLAINEGYDSENPEHRNSMVVPIKDLLNEYYSKDLSRKINGTFAVKRVQGDNLHMVPYGYQKDLDNKSRLILDEESAQYVKLIFQWTQQGQKSSKIANTLNEWGIASPYLRRKQLGLTKTSGANRAVFWKAEYVDTILKNPLYTGDMVYNRYSYPNGYRKTPVENPRSAWQIVEDAHPAIISSELYEAVQKILEERKKATQEKREQRMQEQVSYPDLFQGKLMCLDCHKAMGTHRLRFGNALYKEFVCRNSECSNRTPMAERLIKVLLMDQIRQQLNVGVPLEELKRIIRKSPEYQSKRAQLQRELQEVEDVLGQLRMRKHRIYENFRRGELTESDYFEVKRIIERKEQERQAQLAEIRKQIDAEKSAVASNTEIPMIEKLTPDTIRFSKELIDALVEKIEVGRKQLIKITFSFQDRVQQYEALKDRGGL